MRKGGEEEREGRWEERGRTMRGFIERATSFSHCLHLVDVALAKRGTPQLLGKVRALHEGRLVGGGDEPFGAEEHVALVEGRDV